MGKVTSQRTSLSSKISRDPSMSFNVRDHRSLSKMSVEDDVSRQSYRLPSPTEVQSRSDVSCSLSSELRAISRQRSCKSFSIPSNAPFPSRIDSFKDLGDQFSGSSFSSLSSGSGSSCGSNLSLYERRKAFHVLHAKPGFTGIQPMAPVPSRLPSFEEVQWERNLQRGLGVRIPDSGPSTSTSPKSKTMKRKEELELQGVYSISENSFFSNRDNTRRISERATSAKGLLPKELVKKISKSQSLNRVESMKKDQLRGYPLCKPPTFRHDNLWEDYQQKKLEQDNLQENHVDRKLKKRFSSSGKSLTDSKRPVLNLSREFPLNNKQQSKVSSRKSPLRKSSPLPPLVIPRQTPLEIWKIELSSSGKLRQPPINIEKPSQKGIDDVQKKRVSFADHISVTRIKTPSPLPQNPIRHIWALEEDSVTSHKSRRWFFSFCGQSFTP